MIPHGWTIHPSFDEPRQLSWIMDQGVTQILHDCPFGLVKPHGRGAVYVNIRVSDPGTTPGTRRKYRGTTRSVRLGSVNAVKETHYALNGCDEFWVVVREDAAAKRAGGGDD